MLATTGKDGRGLLRVRRLVGNLAYHHERWAGIISLTDPDVPLEDPSANTFELIPSKSGPVSSNQDILIRLTTEESYLPSFAVDHARKSNGRGALQFARSQAEGQMSELDSGAEIAGQRDIPATSNGARTACSTKPEHVIIYLADVKSFWDFTDGLQRYCKSRYPTLLIDEPAARNITASGRLPPKLHILSVVTASGAAWKKCSNLHSLMGYSNSIGFSDPCSDYWGDSLISYDVLRFGVETIFKIGTNSSLGDLELGDPTPILAKVAKPYTLRGASGVISMRIAVGSYDFNREPTIVLLELTGAQPRVERICGNFSAEMIVTPEPKCPDSG